MRKVVKKTLPGEGPVRVKRGLKLGGSHSEGNMKYREGTKDDVWASIESSVETCCEPEEVEETIARMDKINRSTAMLELAEAYGEVMEKFLPVEE